LPIWGQTAGFNRGGGAGQAVVFRSHWPWQGLPVINKRDLIARFTNVVCAAETEAVAKVQETEACAIQFAACPHKKM
jgi:hypothetical protein